MWDLYKSREPIRILLTMFNDLNRIRKVFYLIFQIESRTFLSPTFISWRENFKERHSGAKSNISWRKVCVDITFLNHKKNPAVFIICFPWRKIYYNENHFHYMLCHLWFPQTNIFEFSATTNWLDQYFLTFWRKMEFPHIFSSNDDKHIRIECPKNTSIRYHNCKDFFNIFLLAVCDVSN